jgi:type IV pilus assembly protein PilM
LVDGVTATAFARATADYARNAQREIVRSLEALCRQWDCAAPEAFFLGGGGSLVDGLPALLEEKLRMPVGRFDPLGGIELSEIAVASGATEPGAFSAELPGLVAFGEEAGALNLIPPPRRAAREFERRKPVWLAAAAVAAIALLPPIWHYRAAAAAAENEAARLESRLIPLRAARAEMNEKMAALAGWRRRIEMLQGIAGGRMNWMAFFADLQARIETVGDAWLEQIVIRRDAPVGENGDSALRLGISGCLLDVEHPLASGSAEAFARARRWLEELAQSPFVASVSDERFDRSRPGMLRFEATVALNFEGWR